MYSKKNRRKHMIKLYSKRVPLTLQKFCWVLDKIEREKKMTTRLARRYGTYKKEVFSPMLNRYVTKLYVNKKDLFVDIVCVPYGKL